MDMPPPATRQVDMPVDGPSAAAGMRRLVIAEAVELEIPTASVGLRMIALVIDLVVVVISLVVVAWVGFQLATLVGDVEAVVVTVITVVAATPFLVTWLVEGLTGGRSLGKAVMGLQVVTVEGAPSGWKHAGIRAAFATFETWLTFGFVAFLTSLASSRGQRLGDMAAGTLVVRQASRSAQAVPTRFMAAPAVAGLVATMDVSSLGHADYQVIRSALLRRGLSPSVHAELCGDVVRSLWPRISSRPLPTSLPAPMVLEGVAAAFQDQHAGPGRASGVAAWVTGGGPA